MEAFQIDNYQTDANRTASGFFRAERSVLGFFGERQEYFDLPQDSGAIEELGDRAWYLAEICTSHNLRMWDCIGAEPTTIAHIAESRKKWLRGDYNQAEYLRRLRGGIAAAWLELAEHAASDGYDLEDVLECNIQKLLDRLARGAIQGDGRR